MATDVFNSQKKYQRTVEKLQLAGYTGRNAEVLSQFEAELYDSDLSLHRAENILGKWKELEPHIDFDLKTATREQLKKLVGKINRNQVKEKELASETLRDYKKAVNSLYYFLDQDEKVDFISASAKKSNRSYVDPRDLPRMKTVKTISEHCKNRRDRAFIHLLYETGMRPVEILNVKWEHLRKSGNVCRVQVHRSKTEKRTIPFRNSWNYLEKWRKGHPDPSLGNYVFTALNTYKSPRYHTLHRALQRASDRAETDLRTNMKAFRKARATFLASKGFNVFQLMKFFGWNQPNTALYYVRLAKNDVFKAYKRKILASGSGGEQRVSGPASNRVHARGRFVAAN